MRPLIQTSSNGYKREKVKTTSQAMRVLVGAAALALISVGSPADARTTCTGDEYFVTCEHSEWTAQGYVTCRASGNPNFLSWTCTNY